MRRPSDNHNTRKSAVQAKVTGMWLERPWAILDTTKSSGLVGRRRARVGIVQHCGSRRGPGRKSRGCREAARDSSEHLAGGTSGCEVNGDGGAEHKGMPDLPSNQGAAVRLQQDSGARSLDE